MPFGWIISYFWSHRLAKPIREKLTQWGIPNAGNKRHHDSVTDGRSNPERASKTVQLLTQLGKQVNQKKSLSQPQQQVTYLGHIWDLKQNKIRPQMPKVQDALKNVKHQLKGNVATPKHIAATAGQLLDQAKSNVSLWGLTRQLMKQAGKAVSIIRYNNSHNNLIKA